VTHTFSAAARAANIDALGREHFDVLVIGGGITGAGVARDAAMRGLRVALVEKGDFASGTSSRSSRLVHGGLRYLEHGQIHLVYEASRERRTLLRIAPHLVRPLQFVWPVFEDARISRWKLQAGLFAYDALALFRNVATHRALSASMISEYEPALRTRGLQGGVSYYDAFTDDIRLTLANVRAAAEAGAVVASYMAAHELAIEDDAVRGAFAEDLLCSRTVRIAARTVVNATGPWSDTIRLLADADAAPSTRGTKGVHVAVPRRRVGNQGALTTLSPIDGRVMFILPSGRLTIIGTTDTDYYGPLDTVRATPDDVTYLLRSANAYFPAAHLSPADVISAWAGVRPLVNDEASTPGAVSREHAVVWTAPGLLTVSGGKLTTYRAMADDVVNAVMRALSQPLRRAQTHRVRLPGGSFASFDDEVHHAASAIGSPQLAEHLVSSYGSEWRDVWEIVMSNPALAANVSPGLPYIAAELVWAVEREMALTLGDLLIRRLHIAFEAHDNGLSAAPAVARVVAPLLGWSAKRIEAELSRYAREVRGMFGYSRESRVASRE
jgi:glycerol-3-phosphate dehydrogenase